MAIFICNKMDFKPKLMKREEEGQYILHTSKKKIHQDISVLNIYVPNKAHPLSETLQLKYHNDPHTLIVGDFNIPLSPMDKSSRKNSNRKILDLTDVIN